MMGRMERSMGVGRVEGGVKEGNEIGKWRREGGKDRKKISNKEGRLGWRTKMREMQGRKKKEGG